MPEPFTLDESDFQTSLTEIRSTESGSASEGESRASPPSGAPTESAASSTPAAPAEATQAEKAVLGENATPQQVEAWRAMPKAWKKEMEKTWNGLPPEAMQYINERETQAHAGISQYKTVADKWNNTLTPFKQWFDHYKIDPQEAFHRLATAHIILKYGKPEDRQRYAQMLVKDYGLDSFIGQPQGEQGQQQPAQLPEEIYQLKTELDGIKARDYERQVEEKRQAVTKFFGDPKNEFAMELKDDIQELLEQGAATTLEQAYEKAMWLNPVVRTKLTQREVENATKPPRKGPSNIKPSSVPASPTDGADESIDDTLRATLGRINSR